MELELSSGERVFAPRCIVALPLGVLQFGNVAFEPQPLALTAARRMIMGDATRFTLVFRERWWERSTHATREALRDLSFLFTPGGVAPVWWTAHPEVQAQPTLTGWAGGPQAIALARRFSENFSRDVCAALANVFAVPFDVIHGALVSVETHDWRSDPFSRGSYSYVAAGALDAPAAMAQPEARTLFFAGEHTDTTGHWGTVHAAVSSGLRAAAQVLEDRS